MEELFVDPPLVMGHGGNMETSAGQIPDPPANFNPALGTDELSTAIGEEMPKAEAPINDGLPPLKRDAKETASNIKQAAQRYTETDQTLSREYDRHQFDAAGAPGGSGAAGAAGQMGQMGQMMGIPMQMAAQAAQIPMQMMGMAAAIPQGVMQGVQSAMQQVGQMSGQLGGQDGEKPGDQLDKPDQDEQRQSAQREEEEKREAEQRGAAHGQSGAGRAPEPPSGSESGSPATPPASPVRPPAQTRPADAADGINL